MYDDDDANYDDDVDVNYDDDDDVAHCCAIFLGNLGINIQISISERSSGWATN